MTYTLQYCSRCPHCKYVNVGYHNLIFWHCLNCDKGHFKIVGDQI